MDFSENSNEFGKEVSKCRWSAVIFGFLLKSKPTRYANCRPGSSVGIANDYGLDGPGTNPGGDEIFWSFRPTLGPTQLPVKWVPGLSQGGKVLPGRAADHSPPSSAAVMEE